ncbi:MAG: hypothetical protein H7Y41_01650 [Hyphomonadaceae bacterium]|nr:hypothetical protein [Clostridia bacterium]
MEHAILAVVLWVVVIAIIPFERIKALSAVAIVAFILRILVDNIAVGLDFYRYQHILIPIGNAPFFEALGSAAMGVFMINWLTEKSSSKIFAVFLVSIGLSIMQYTYIQLGAFAYGRYDTVLNFIQSVAVLSIFVWLSLAVVGEHKVYSGNKSRARSKRTA